MKILLAPSETKAKGGSGILKLESLILPSINSARESIISNYQSILNSKDLNKLSKLMGLKKESEIKEYILNLQQEPVLKAIQRYTGVAFDFLEYNTLDRAAQNYIDENLLIFSNLFGILRAKDKIPLYKLKQGESVGDIKIDKLYNSFLKEPMDTLLESEDIIDLRAKYYEKFYKPNKKYTTLKFLKNGKVVSHWAKAYRGMVLREIAINKIDTIDQFLKLNFKTLDIKEIIEKKAYNEIIYNIVE